MSVSADANITETFLHFWTHKVHYKLQQSTLQNFDDGGLLSGWSFVRVVFSPGLAFLVVFCPVVLCPVVFCPYTGRYFVLVATICIFVFFVYIDQSRRVQRYFDKKYVYRGLCILHVILLVRRLGLLLA